MQQSQFMGPKQHLGLFPNNKDYICYPTVLPDAHIESVQSLNRLIGLK